MKTELANLVKILQLAYSGELAAGYAYRGHWRSTREENIRARIQQIEEEEWHHRRLVGEMLNKLGYGPDKLREWRAGWTGRVLGILCHVMGKLTPFYAAGKLESRNIREYEAAARYAAQSGNPEFIDCLLTMAEVEWEHEKYFRSCVENHPFGPMIRMWPSPPPKETIRSSFQSEISKL